MHESMGTRLDIHEKQRFCLSQINPTCIFVQAMVSPTFTLVLIALRESAVPQSSWSGISATENLMRTPPLLWKRSSTSDTALAADSRTTTTASADGETQVDVLIAGDAEQPSSPFHQQHHVYC